jgi:hypothetical protein
MAAAERSTFGFRLVSSCGETLGTVESSHPHFHAGETVVLNGIGYWVRSVIPVELVAEFVDAPVHGVLEVELI